MDYQGNSNKAKEERPDKQIVKVVTGEVIQKEPGIGRKFKSVFFGGDLKTSMGYVYADILLPAARNAIFDAFLGALGGVLWGEARRRRPPEPRTITQYNNPINRANNVTSLVERRPYLPDQPPRYTRSDKLDLDDIILSRKEDAEIVVERLIDVVNQFHVATVSDLYDLLGLRAPFTGNSYGWRNLSRIDIRQDRNGYRIDLPPVEMLGV